MTFGPAIASPWPFHCPISRTTLPSKPRRPGLSRTDAPRPAKEVRDGVQLGYSCLMADPLAATSKENGRAAGDKPATHRRAGLAVADAPELLSDVGYLLVHGSPFEHGPAYLLVAIRPRPTRAHFDPERIEYWSRESGLAEKATLELPVSSPCAGYSWGVIKVIDRVAAVNRFVSFGGSLNVVRDGGLHAALFRSDAPILALSGRGEAGDPLATSVVGFFARLSAACGADAALARAVSGMEPMAVYAAYLARALELYGGHLAAQGLSPRVLAMMRSEYCLVGHDFGPAAIAGEALARRLEQAEHLDDSDRR